MRCTIVLLLGLFLLFNTIRPAHTCSRRRRPPPRLPPNRPPEFSTNCFRTIVVAAGPGKTGAHVSWPPNKVRATDPDSAQQPPVSLVSAQGSGSYFSGVSGGHTVIYKARDSRNGVRYCQFTVIVTVKYCPSVYPIRYGTYRCTGEETNVYGSRCTTECNTGYELSSSSQRTVECLSNNSRWSNFFPSCEPVNCGPPGTVQNGQVQCYPACGYMYPTTCSVKCEAGYKYGLNWTLISCKKDGTWDPLYSCVDGQAPKFPNDCPQNLTLNSGPLGSKVVVTWTDPATSDNSEQGVTLTSSPAKGASLPPGTHTVTIRATDAAGNWDNCRFQVDIKLWTCPPLQIHQGRATCDEGYMVGSHCNVTCNEGYQIQDSAAAVTCINSSSSSSSSSQDEAVWSSPDTSCEPVECPEVPLDYGTYICPNGRTYTKRCSPECDQGFRFDGPSFIQCYANGSWAKLGSCKDEEPPSFPDGCPDNIDTFAASLGQSTFLTWTAPNVADNSRGPVDLSSDRQPGSEFTIGVNTVTYTAIDPSGNMWECHFTVTVSTLVCNSPDLEAGKQRKLMTYNCTDGFVYGAACTLNCTYGYPLVGSNTITCGRNDQTYPPTMSWDWSGPSSVPPECAENACPDLEPPAHGSLTCNLGNNGWDCLMSCQDPYDVPSLIENSGHIYCTISNGYWIPETVPDCTVFRRPNQVRVQSDLFYYSDSCNMSTDQLKQNFITRMSNSDILKDACVGVPTCVVENVQVTCGAIRKKRDTHRMSRRQSGNSPYYVVIEFYIPLNISGNASSSNQEVYQMTQQIAQNLQTQLEAAVHNGTFDEEGLHLDYSFAVGAPVMQVLCPQGTMSRRHADKFSCVGCSKGHYLSEEGKCYQCPTGTYADTDHAAQCTPCPLGQSTLTTAATSSADCFELCTAGHVSPNGFLPCQPCPAGQYQAGVGATRCESCPVNTWTLDAGAISLLSCVEADVRLSNSSLSGSIKAGNLSSLTVSLRVAFPDASSSVTVTMETGESGSVVLVSHVVSAESLVDEVRESKQRLFHHFTFIVASPDETQFPDGVTVYSLTQQLPDSIRLTLHSQQRRVLVSSVGMYGGTLTTEEVSSLASSCTVYSALNLLTWSPDPGSVLVPSVCDAVDECSPNPCGDHGVCLNLLGGYECRCQGRWSGADCEVPPDPCSEQQCQNNATCVPAADANYTCTCPSLYSGVFCEHEKVPGGWTEWLAWSQCGCGTQHQRQRLCTNPSPQNGGAHCPGQDTQLEDCSTSLCSDQQASWGSWPEWSLCSADCRGGQRSRKRTCEGAGGTGQGVCDGSATEVETCNTHTCPVHGDWNVWSGWSLCSATCGSGSQTRQRICDIPVPAYGGDYCTGSDTDQRPCQEESCPECGPLGRGTGELSWKCTETLSPYYYKRCTVSCRAGFVLLNEDEAWEGCGHNTSYSWNFESRSKNSIQGQPVFCAKSVTSTNSYSAKASTSTDCDPANQDAAKNGVTQNIENNVACTLNGLCSVSVETKCKVSRKRSTPLLQISVTASPDIGISDSDLAANATAWAQYLQLMSMLNQSIPDLTTLQSLFTFTLPGGQTITPDTGSIDYEVEAVCPDGSIQRDFFCMECPVGSMEHDEVCVQCPLGFYQDQPASTSCKPCPPGKTWELSGAVSLLQCVYPLETSTTSTQQPPLTTPEDDDDDDDEMDTDPLETSTTSTQQPPLTTPEDDDDDDDEMDTGVMLGILFGVLALLVIIFITVCFIYKHISKQQRTSRRGSWLSLNRVFTPDPVRTVSHATNPLPYYEENAPPSYQQSMEKGRAPLYHVYHATAATSFVEEIPKD